MILKFDPCLKPMKKLSLFLVFAFCFCGVLLLPSETKQVFQLAKQEKITEEIENDVFIPSDYDNKTLFFLNQMKKKRSHFSSYDVRFTDKNIYTTSEDWRFFESNFELLGPVQLNIHVSEGAYKYLTEYLLNKNLTRPITVGSGSGLFDCLKTCFERRPADPLASTTKCDCASWFSNPNQIGTKNP